MKRPLPATSAILAFLGLVTVAALVSGCGGKVIDYTKAEEFIRQDLAGVGVEVESVICPKGIEVSAGTDFECEVSADGEQAVVEMRIVDDEGLVRPVEIRAVAGQAESEELETS